MVCANMMGTNKGGGDLLFVYVNNLFDLSS